MGELATAAVYERLVAASVARIWENVFDWQHLPSLHDSSFAACELLDTDAAGWRVALTSQPGGDKRRQVVKLHADRKAHAYRVVTEQGLGTGSEIRVQMHPLADHQTKVVITYHIDEPNPERLALIGQGFVALYTRLWDEDETMMIRREAVSALPPPQPFAPMDLGSEAEITARLPLTLTAGERPVRLALVEGSIVAFSALCPHWLGPLDETPLEGAIVRCPWHDYRFDVRTGHSCDGRGLTLEAAPRVTVTNGRVWLSAPQTSGGE
jgi:nitrite reductase/ring-hydroxylating ferredoxin subunit